MAEIELQMHPLVADCILGDGIVCEDANTPMEDRFWREWIRRETEKLDRLIVHGDGLNAN